MTSSKKASRACADASDDDSGALLRKPPKLRRNRQYARVRLNGVDHYCGAWGSKEAKQRYRELIAEWNERGCKPPSPFAKPDPEGATINEIVVLYETHELPIRPASMQARIKAALRPLRQLYGTRLANDFHALDLMALRLQFLAGCCLSRMIVNQNIALVRSVFTWAAGVGRVDERVPFRLSTVKGLRRGQGARESRVVQPVEWATVEATLEHVSAPVRGLILCQWFTGARPGEVCALTADDIDRSGKVWIYTPKHHKTEHHGKSRRIFLGAETQAVIAPFLVRRPSSQPLFSPKEAIVEQKVTAAKKRRTRVQPSQKKRAAKRAARPKREVAEGYVVDTYRRAIDRAVHAANAAAKREELRNVLGALAADPITRAEILDAIDRLPDVARPRSRARLVRRVGDASHLGKVQREDLAKTVDKVIDAKGRYPGWHPHQLRHAFAYRAERETGDLDAVRASLGHSTLAMAARYAHPDDRKARELAERIG